MTGSAERVESFGSSDPFSLGVEEELFLVDPVTGSQANSSAAVLSRLSGLGGRVERELHACQIELITDVHATPSAAVHQLGELRRAVTATGAGILGAGTHPTGAEGEAAITDKERYERIHFLLGDAAVTPVGGLHVHVGMPDSETAIRVFNSLRCELPLLQALAANSPFRHGRDTGLASAREVSVRAWPRSGVPRAMRDFDDFRELSRLLRAPRTFPTTRGSGGSYVPIPDSAPSRSVPSTRRPRSPIPPRWSPSFSASRAMQPSQAQPRNHLPSCWRRAFSARHASAFSDTSRTRMVSCAQSASSSTARWREPNRTRANSDALRSFAISMISSDAAVKRALSEPPTSWPASTR